MKTRASVGLLLVLGGILHGTPVLAGPSNWEGPGADFNTNSNWSAAVPNDIADFNAVATTSLSLSASITLNTLVFNSGASAYTLNIPTTNGLTFNDLGIVDNSASTQTFTNNGGTLNFQNASGAADAHFMNDGTGGGGILNFVNTATASSATIRSTNGGQVDFSSFASAGSAVLITSDNGGATNFLNNATASSATLESNNGGGINFSGSANGGDAYMTNDNGGGTNFLATSSAGSATIINNNGGKPIGGIPQTRATPPSSTTAAARPISASARPPAARRSLIAMVDLRISGIPRVPETQRSLTTTRAKRILAIPPRPAAP